MITQFLLNTKELIVLGNPVTAAGGAAFDLSCVQCNGKICNGGILRFTGAVGDDGGLARPVCHGDCIQSLRQRTDLIHFNQYGVTDSRFDTLLKTLGIGYEKVVTNQLKLLA